MTKEEETLASYEAKKVMACCHDAAGTECLIAWMDDLIEENITLQVALVEGPDEQRNTRIDHLASQISVYRRMKDAAKRALDMARGKKPPERLASESAEVATL